MANGIGARTDDGGVGVDPGAGDEVAVGAAVRATTSAGARGGRRRSRRASRPPATASCRPTSGARRRRPPRSRPMPMIRPTPAATVPAATEPSSNRGTITWSITHCTAMLDATVHRAKSAAPQTAMMNGRGCRRTMAREHPDALAGAVETTRRDAPEPRNVSTGSRRGHRTPSWVRRWRTPLGRVRAWTRPISRCSSCGSCSALFLAAPRLQQGVGRREARRHGRVVRVDRHALAARPGPRWPRRPRSAPGCCSPSAC